MADMLCELLGENSTHPLVLLWRSRLRQEPALAHKLAMAIYLTDRENTLANLLRSDFGRHDPKRASQLALAETEFDGLTGADFDSKLDELFWAGMV
jgi:hypothetical protein